MKVAIKQAKVIQPQSVTTSIPKMPSAGKAGKQTALSALFGRKRARPSVNNVPTRTPEL